MPVCEGPARDDLARDEQNRKARAGGRLAARRLFREHGLPVKITAVDFPGAENVFVPAPHSQEPCGQMKEGVDETISKRSCYST